MLICKDEIAYKCSKIKIKIIDEKQYIEFVILEKVTHNDLENLFIDNSYYFYDDVLNGKLLDTDNTKLVGLRITYNADSTCNITIKLIKGVVGDES